MAGEQPQTRHEDPPVPPVGDRIHMPEPSFLPVLVALGITIALVGIVMSWVLFAIGFVIFLIATIRWIRDVRRDIDDLPLEHGEEH